MRLVCTLYRIVATKLGTDGMCQMNVGGEVSKYDVGKET